MEIKALVANSSEKERKNIARSLKEIGIRTVTEATDANRAIEMVKKGKFDVFFAEYNTTNAEGEELATAVRKIDNKMPIIVTAPQSKNVDELKKACPTASNYLTTPFTTEQLRKTVRDYVPSLAV